MAKPIAHSYSSISSFETCPKRHYIIKVAKEVTEPPTEALTWGNTVHKALELRLRDGTELPAKLSKYEQYAKKLTAMSGSLLVEEEIALTRDFERVGWWDRAAWLRGKLDVAVVDGTKAAILDWKTGSRKPDNDQLNLFAGLAFAVLPDVQTVSTGFIWLKEGKFDKRVFTREQTPVIWQDFLPRIERVERAHAENKWPAKPSGLCRAYCPVGRARCEYCGKP
jgi:CRISPR/Cas system-associated exonuclease Cas4 (RecB family)